MHWSDPSHPSQSSASSVVEHLTFNQGVVSSSLTRGTTPYFLTLPPRASKQHLPEAEIASGFSFPARRFGEMVDARDLKSLEAIPHAGSSPATGTSEFTRLFGKKCRFFINFDFPRKIKTAFTAVVIAARIDLSRKCQKQSQATVQRFSQASRILFSISVLRMRF